jgi:hypothetical protein
MALAWRSEAGSGDGSIERRDAAIWAPSKLD